MKSDGKRRGMGWASVTGETLIPRDANAHVELGFVSLAVGSLVSSPVAA